MAGRGVKRACGLPNNYTGVLQYNEMHAYVDTHAVHILLLVKMVTNITDSLRIFNLRYTAC